MANRYANTAVVQTASGSSYYSTTRYPDIPVEDSDYYVITTVEDRLDLLAYAFYQDSSLWWIIASANSLTPDSVYVPIGTQLRIPKEIENIVTNFKLVNNATT